MESGPVFADSSGQRRRVLRFAGLGAAAVLAVCLGAVVVAMTGGPQAPFTHWAVQQPAHAAGSGGTSQAAARNSAAAAQVPGAAGSQPQGQPPSAAASPSAGASPTAGPSATATATTATGNSPAATNRAGKTPPGRTRSPNPRKSASVA